MQLYMKPSEIYIPAEGMDFFLVFFAAFKTIELSPHTHTHMHVQPH